jgi:very-short-patch-repair endonuclease
MPNSNRSHRDEFDVKMARPSTISVRFSPLDFLVKVQSGKGVISIIIEYDGFKEHFTDLEKVDAYNHEDYYRPDDVERQKVLEGYGYRFLRINRFNLGRDPVKTLDARLSKLAQDALQDAQL